jgi:two-component system, LuxR family, response regulator FixJ
MSGPEGRVYIVDDDAAVLGSLEALLSSEGFETASCGSAEAFLRQFDSQGAACVLLDVRMPGMDGLTLLETMRRERIAVPVVVLTGHGDVPMAVRAMRAGAADFVEKPFSATRLLDSVRCAIARRLPGQASADPALTARFSDLTPRERQVMEQMVIGLPNKQIAYELGMSPRTVEIHRGRVMHKTGARSLSHLVRMAVRAGLEPDDR